MGAAQTPSGERELTLPLAGVWVCPPWRRRLSSESPGRCRPCSSRSSSSERAGLRRPGTAWYVRDGGGGDRELAQIREALGLDAPLTTQYWHFVTNALQGDLGTSYAPAGAPRYADPGGVYRQRWNWPARRSW